MRRALRQIVKWKSTGNDARQRPGTIDCARVGSGIRPRCGAKRNLRTFAVNETRDGRKRMNHKRGKPKNARAGCLLCKPNKMSGWSKDRYGHTGFGKLRKVAYAKQDLAEFR